ncbi:hypothetical protein GGU11DRAFT_773802 [Lentinula aff. detonsa]|nr:hypothetical protein GGU11DRAFT_773802 [Lentinula aff. detonsa]
MDDDLKIITAITDALNSSLDTAEVLPGTIEQWQTNPAVPFLLVEKHLGLPQKLLYKIYPCALSLLKRFRSSSLMDPSSREANALLEASSIILFTNPAHQSALNQRKRLILAGCWSVKQELSFSKLLLSSSRVASKQSILWDHRRWLFEFEYINGRNRPGLIPTTMLQNEVELILQSCESYPRNYYAWAHWEFCMDGCREACTSSRTEQLDYFRVVIFAFGQLLRWMEYHISDHTAAHHLCRLVSRFHALETVQGQLSDINFTFSRLSEQAVSLLTRYADHEALWMYLRAIWTASEDRVLREKLEISVTSLPPCQYHDKLVSWCTLVKQSE